jgi:hypothetical protein
MILTFSRQTGGTRIKERDDWLRVLKENTSSSFEQVIRKVMPGIGQSSKKAARAAPPRIEIVSSPVSQKVPPAKKTAAKKEAEDIAPVKKIITKSTGSSLPPSAVKESDVSPPGYGTYCSRCGNRVPDGSKFCNRCGSQIVVPGNLAESKTPQAAVSQSSVPEYEDRSIQPIDKDISAREPLIIPSLTSVPSKTQGADSQRQETPEEQISIVTPIESTSSLSDSDLHGTGDKSEAAQPVIMDSHDSEQISPSGKPRVPQKPWDVLSGKPGKKVILGIIVVIIIVAVVLGAFFIYPMIANSEGGTSGDATAFTTIPTITKNSGTKTMPTRTIKPTATPTYRPTPGNSGSTVGI